ncbi:MAG: hypothetical protein KKC19_03725 [Nanoarchaeota archaeon]|nr:hypothetical protein [Nanoarchaeota archaeon]
MFDRMNGFETEPQEIARLMREYVELVQKRDPFFTQRMRMRGIEGYLKSLTGEQIVDALTPELFSIREQYEELEKSIPSIRATAVFQASCLKRFQRNSVDSYEL